MDRLILVLSRKANVSMPLQEDCFDLSYSIEAIFTLAFMNVD